MAGQRSTVTTLLLMLLQQRYEPASGNKVNVQLELSEENVNKLVSRIIDIYSNNKNGHEYPDCRKGESFGSYDDDTRNSTATEDKMLTNGHEKTCKEDNCNHTLRNKEFNDDKQINHFYNDFTYIGNHTKSISTENTNTNIKKFSPLHNLNNHEIEPVNFRSAQSELEIGDANSDELRRPEAKNSISDNEKAISLLTRQANLLEQLLKRVERTRADNQTHDVYKEMFEKLMANGTKRIRDDNKPVRLNLELNETTNPGKQVEETAAVKLPSIDVTEIKAALKNDPWIQRILHLHASNSRSNARKFNAVNEEPSGYNIMAPINFAL